MLITSTLYSSSLLSSESKTRVLTTDLSSESSRTSSNPSSDDKSVSGTHVAELGIEDRLTTSEDPSFTACERAIKGSLAEIIGGGVAGEVLSVWDASMGMTPF